MTDKTDDTYLINGDHGMTVMGHLTACHKCGRKILVEMGLFGVPHHTGLSVTCGECLVLSEQFCEEQPEIVSKIESWLLRHKEA
jgi:hypothetical protein